MSKAKLTLSMMCAKSTKSTQRKYFKKCVKPVYGGVLIHEC